MDGVLTVEADFRVIDESPDWIVVDKAAPLVVHPTGKRGEPTLLGGLEALLAYEIANGVRLSIINRLDRETSGLVLVAKHRRAARWFSKQMEKRRVKKEYLAIAHGWPEPDEWSERAPILRAADVEFSPIHVRQRVHPLGKPCRTHFRVGRRFVRDGERFSLIECLPETGRMHQIRVHLAHGGHPIVGDKIYNGNGDAYLDFIAGGWTAELQQRLGLPRHALHSTGLEFKDPDGRVIGWKCGLPPDFINFATPNK